MAKKALGKGIGALLGESAVETAAAAEVLLSKLQPNPQQPRQEFDDAGLRELADSIRDKGVLQPVLVEEGQDGSYVIIAGERRVRAARLAGLSRIPVIVRRFTTEEKLEIAIIENVQRENLTPIEEAQAYRRLMEMSSLSQEQVAQKVGKDRSTVANTIRLLKLPPEAQEALSKGEITPGHARALLMAGSPADQAALLKRMLAEGISVREAESSAGSSGKGRNASARTGKGKPPTAAGKDPDLLDLERRLIEKLGTKVEVKGTGSQGRVEISYFSAEDLDRLLEILG
jgi:ParB family transcriptional regulator, chromosome partitioning protein